MNKFNRIAEDKSQLEQFAQSVQAGDIGGKPVTLSDNSLVIPEQPQPEPVITIDGVAYFHKQEFKFDDIDETVFSEQKRLNLLTGEIEASSANTSMAKGVYAGGSSNYPVFQLFLSWPGPNPSYNFNVMGVENVYSPLNYTSRAFTVVDTQEEVTDNTKICLPTCSAYYGFLSEDGKTFISYYNLKSDGAPEYIDSVKQGNAVIPLKDVRLPDATVDDVGKIVAVNAEGELVLQEAGGGSDLPVTVIETSIGYGGGTVQDILDALGTTDQGNYSIFLKSVSGGFLAVGLAVFTITKAGPNTYYRLQQATMFGYKDYSYDNPSTNIWQGTLILHATLPTTESLDSGKTYVCKFTNGSVAWVEEAAQ